MKTPDAARLFAQQTLDREKARSNRRSVTLSRRPILEFLQQNPLLLAPVIFFARVLDVSLGTVRTILVIRGRRYWAAALGFFEILIWLAAAGQVFQNLSVWYLAVSYAGGFAAGNIVGIAVEARLAMGLELVRAISENRDITLAARLRGHGFDVTELEGRGHNATPIEIILVVEHRRRVPWLLECIKAADPDAVWTTSDVKTRPVPRPVLVTRTSPLLGQSKRK